MSRCVKHDTYNRTVRDSCKDIEEKRSICRIVESNETD